MNKMRFKNKNQEKKLKGKGFYIALGVCMVAIGAAAWTTYDSVTEFINPSGEDSITSKSEKIKKEALLNEQEANNTLSGITDESSQSSKFSETKEVISAVDSTEEKDTLVVYPVSKNLIKPFSDTNPVYSKTFGDWRVHNACDFSADKNSVVRAITSGKISEIYEDPTLGNVIVIEHDNNVVAYYCGLINTDTVKKGKVVSSGDEIGYLGEVPSEIKDEPHLHFAIKKGDKWIDPMEILKEAKAD